MGWLTGKHSAYTYICPDHRYVVKSSEYHAYAEGARLDVKRSFVCTTCRKALINMGTRWRAPKKTNDKAWTKVLNGDIWWDKRALDKISLNHNVTNLYMRDYYLKQMANRDDKS